MHLLQENEFSIGDQAEDKYMFLFESLALLFGQMKMCRSTMGTRHGKGYMDALGGHGRVVFLDLAGLSK